MNLIDIGEPITNMRQEYRTNISERLWVILEALPRLLNVTFRAFNLPNWSTAPSSHVAQCDALFITKGGELHFSPLEILRVSLVPVKLL